MKWFNTKFCHMSFEIFRAVWFSNPFFWDVTLCHRKSRSKSFWGSTILQNSRNHLPSDTASHPGKKRFLDCCHLLWQSVHDDNKTQPTQNILSHYLQHTFKKDLKYDVHHTLSKGRLVLQIFNPLPRNSDRLPEKFHLFPGEQWK